MKPRVSWILLTPENGLPVTLVLTSGKSVQPLRSRSRSGVPVLVRVAAEAVSVRKPLPGISKRNWPLRGIVTTQLAVALGPGA